MIATILQDRSCIKLQYESENERHQTIKHFTRKIKDWKFKAKRFPGWTGDVRFVFGENQDKIYVGLWNELLEFGKRFGYKVKLVNTEYLFDQTITYEYVEKFCLKLFEHHPKTPYPRQIDAVYQAMKYKYCSEFLSTSAGKTLIIYCYMMLLLQLKQVKRILVITPDPDLAIQNYNEWVDYERGKFGMKICLLYGGSKMKDIMNHKIVIGNFQYLALKDKEWFEEADFGAIFVDEAQRVKSTSIRNIIENCGVLTRKAGFSGSIKPNPYADYYTILAYLGPIVKKISKKELMDSGDAAKINVEVFVLDWATDKLKKDCYLQKALKGGDEALRFEQRMIRESETRLEWICRLINKLDGSTLVFFSDVMGGFGRRIESKLKEITKHKDIYYMDGSTSKSTRGEIMKLMENKDVCCVANWGVFSVGKSVKNIRYIVCVENTKDYEKLSQGSGRGMRINSETGKDRFTWVDIVDDMRIEITNTNGDPELHTNYMYQWFKERKKFYKDEGFDINVRDVDLRNF